MNLTATLEGINPDKPAPVLDKPVIKHLPDNEIQKDIERLCTSANGLHYGDLFSIIGKLVSGGIPHDDLINNAHFFEQYISADSETMQRKSVADVINEHRKNYPDQVGSRARVADMPTEDISKHVYFPSWDNKPKELKPVLSLNGTGFLTQQNLSAVIASPGMGKSSVIEATISSLVNPECDTLGITADPLCRGALFIDNERTDYDVWNSYYRINKRAGIDRSGNLGNIVIAGMRAISRVENRRGIIISLLEKHNPGLLFIDGAGDLVYDTNDLEQAIECREWIRHITKTYDVSVLTTLHPNPNNPKPRGHQGSELCRESESILLIKNYDDDTRIITTDFEHGKNRNNAPITAAFRWSDEHKMFVSADFDEVQGAKDRKKSEADRAMLIELAKAVLPAPKAQKPAVLKQAIIDHLETSPETAKRRITAMRDENIIEKGQDGHYRLVIR